MSKDTAGDLAGRECIAFAGRRRVASGPLAEVAGAAKELIDQGDRSPVLIFDRVGSHQIEVDFRGTPEDVLRRLEPKAKPLSDVTETSGPAGRTPGRPRLGVVAREVTLLPRHWEWLGEQPGGASVTLRKLVEEARRSTDGETRKRRAQESCYRFMNVMAGDEPGYEEALRALYAGDSGRFEEQTGSWPTDVRDHARRLALPTFG